MRASACLHMCILVLSISESKMGPIRHLLKISLKLFTSRVPLTAVGRMDTGISYSTRVSGQQSLTLEFCCKPGKCLEQIETAIEDTEYQ